MTPDFTHAIGGIALLPQWFIWRLTWNATKGKYEKHPIYHRTNPMPMDSADPANWMPYLTACETLRRYREDEPDGAFTLGWRMTQDCGYWFLDLDSVYADGVWAPKAEQWYAALPGVFFEYSASGNGAHLIGNGVLPAHRKKHIKGFEIDCELYTEARSIAFGTTGQAWGSADVAAPAILDVLVEAFAPTYGMDDEGGAGRWDAGPRPDWSGPREDDELLGMAMRSSSVMSTLGAKASFAQLWSNAPELGKLYAGGSEIDMALAQHLAFWTGCDAVRMERLMRRSALHRAKWDEHRTYLKELTIEAACALQRDVYKAPVMRELYVVPPPGLGVVEVIAPAQVQALDAALDLIGSASSDVDMHNRIIPQVRGLEIPPALMPRLVKTINKMLKVWDADLPSAQVRALLGGAATREVAASAGDALRPVWVDDYVYLSSPDRFLEVPSCQALTGMALHRKLARQPAVPMTNAGTKMDVAKLMTEQWNVQTVHDSAYHAAMPAVFEFQGASWVNTYNPASRPLPAPSVAPEAMAGIQSFVNHVRRICRGEDGAAEVLLQWLAWQVQRPGDKIRWMPLIVGVEGSGKSLFENVMVTCLGSANVESIVSSTVCNAGGFTDWAEGKAVGFFEELHISGAAKYQVWNTVKPYVTNDRVSINRKTRKGVSIMNGTNYFAFSNFDNAVPITEADRRVMVVRTPFANIQGMWADAGVQNDAQYFDAMFESLREYPGAWVQWLLSYPIPNTFDTRRAPATKAKARMTGAGRDELEELARALVDDGAVGLGYLPWGFSSIHLCGALAMRGHKPQGQTIHFMFSHMGFQKVGRCRSGNSYTTIYVKPEFVETSPTELYKKMMG